jgi:protoheme IX farnesyltransferase
MGFCSAIAAYHSIGGLLYLSNVLLITLGILLGAGGANGLTNYLDRALDLRMERTRHRSLPSLRINPHYLGFLWSFALVFMGLSIALWFNYYALLAGIAGTLCSVIFRKTELTHFLGGASSASPVVIGWVAINPHMSSMLALVSLFVMLWVIHHVWAIMLFYQSDYLNAGIQIFPLRSDRKTIMPVFWLLALILIILAIAITINLSTLSLGIGILLSLYNFWGTFQLNNSSITNSIQRKRFKTASYSLLIGLFSILAFLPILY